MGKLAFAMTGPQGGQIIEMDPDDFTQAERDGWAIDFERANLGGDPDPFRGHNTASHAQAEAYLAKRGLYPTREMRPDTPTGPKAKPTTGPEPAEPTPPAKSTSGDREDEIEQEKRKAGEESQPKTGDKPKPSPAKK
jgi:hypothetical protein